MVGAGPGDPGLLTLKAKRRLEEADFVVYDYLANPAHLKHTRPSAVTVCVGKGYRHKTLSQEKLNRMIIAEARKGRRVVRLKGGDPYLFGRGGEEALVLARSGIPFEVIPGVTSAVACAAYAGIPLTFRHFNSSVTFLTGHRADSSYEAWEHVPKSGTLAVYMGLYNLETVAETLIETGFPPETKAAVIEWGTLPRQRSCDGTLADIAAAARRMGIRPPAMVIVGEGVSLRKSLNWFERLPLFGKRVLITRARDKAGALADKLSEMGAEPLGLAAIETAPGDKRAIDAAIRRLPRTDWIVFTSVTGVEAFFSRLRALGKDTRSVTARVASVGPETSRALGDRGIRPDLEPRRYETAALAEAFRRKNLKGKRVALFRTDIATPELERNLRKLGALVERVIAYRTRVPKDLKKALPGVLAGGFDAAAFTSGSTVDHFVRAVGRARARAWSRKAVFASIGPVTSRALRRHGLKVGCQARVFTTDGLAEALRAKWGKR